MAADVGRHRPVALWQRRHHLVPARPRVGEAVEQDEVRRHRPHHDRNRHLPPAARLLRRAGPLRPGARLHLARIAQHADPALADARTADPLLVTHRRTLRGVLRPRRRQGRRASGGADLHLGDGGGQLCAGRHRGLAGTGPAHRAHRRSPPGAARQRRRARPSISSSSTATPSSGSARWESTRPRPTPCAGSASSRAAPTRPPRPGGPGPVHLNFPLARAAHPRRTPPRGPGAGPRGRPRLGAARPRRSPRRPPRTPAPRPPGA